MVSTGAVGCGVGPTGTVGFASGPVGASVGADGVPPGVIAPVGVGPEPDSVEEGSGLGVSESAVSTVSTFEVGSSVSSQANSMTPDSETTIPRRLKGRKTTLIALSV